MDKVLFTVLGLGVGYVFAKATTPLPVPRDSDNRPVTQTAAAGLLSVCGAVGRVRPQLEMMAHGEVPTPLQLVSLARSFS